jgi:hypothetical protein
MVTPRSRQLRLRPPYPSNTSGGPPAGMAVLATLIFHRHRWRRRRRALGRIIRHPGPCSNRWSGAPCKVSERHDRQTRRRRQSSLAGRRSRTSYNTFVGSRPSFWLARAMLTGAGSSAGFFRRPRVDGIFESRSGATGTGVCTRANGSFK